MLPQVLSLSTKGVVAIWVGGVLQSSPPTLCGGAWRFGLALKDGSDRVPCAASARTPTRTMPSPTTAAIQLFGVMVSSRLVPATGLGTVYRVACRLWNALIRQ